MAAGVQVHGREGHGLEFVAFVQNDAIGDGQGPAAWGTQGCAVVGQQVALQVGNASVCRARCAPCDRVVVEFVKRGISRHRNRASARVDRDFTCQGQRLCLGQGHARVSHLVDKATQLQIRAVASRAQRVGVRCVRAADHLEAVALHTKIERGVKVGGRCRTVARGAVCRLHHGGRELGAGGVDHRRNNGAVATTHHHCRSGLQVGVTVCKAKPYWHGAASKARHGDAGCDQVDEVVITVGANVIDQRARPKV